VLALDVSPFSATITEVSRGTTVPSKTIALIFDFDDTLTDDSTSAFLAHHGVDVERFWTEEVNQLVTADGWDNTCAYLHLLLSLAKTGRLPAFNASDLRAFGQTLRPYPGLKTLFRDLRKLAREESFELEFYIVSGGLQDIIEGFQLRPEFKAVWGCQLASDQPDGPLTAVKRIVTFTEKTRFLFEINKGLSPEVTSKRPYEVNKDVPLDQRRIPFANMVYVGDGLSDIPCFSLLTKRPNNDVGIAVGVFKPSKSAKKAWEELIAPKRVISAHAPRYGPNQDLGALLRAIVATRMTELKLPRVY